MTTDTRAAALSSCDGAGRDAYRSVVPTFVRTTDPAGYRAKDHRACPIVSRVIHSGMDNISVRELRNNGGRVLQRVAGGETLTVTMDGQPIAELRPLPGRGLTAATLLQRWRRLPPVDAQQLRTDLDRVLDASPWSVG